MRWSWFVGQNGGRSKAYSGIIDHAAKVLTRLAVPVEPAEGQASRRAWSASPAAFLFRRPRLGWSPALLRQEWNLHEIRSPQMHGTLSELALALVQQRRCPLLRGELGNAPGQGVATPGIGRELFGVDRVAQAAVGRGFE